MTMHHYDHISSFMLFSPGVVSSPSLPSPLLLHLLLLFICFLLFETKLNVRTPSTNSVNASHAMCLMVKPGKGTRNSPSSYFNLVFSQAGCIARALEITFSSLSWIAFYKIPSLFFHLVDPFRNWWGKTLHE